MQLTAIATRRTTLSLEKSTVSAVEQALLTLAEQDYKLHNNT